MWPTGCVFVTPALKGSKCELESSKVVSIHLSFSISSLQYLWYTIDSNPLGDDVSMSIRYRLDGNLFKLCPLKAMSKTSTTIIFDDAAVVIHDSDWLQQACTTYGPQVTYGPQDHFDHFYGPPAFIDTSAMIRTCV